ncbi:MAG: carboxypeptidase M32, partial [Flavisolibacter sp.]|nr:carboxypeptidase M32 [Flavisolibacter sp.]
MPNGKELYELYKSNMHRIADVRYATAVLQWDQETYLPSKGAAARGRQISTLSEIAHQLFSEESLGDLLQELLSKDDLSAAGKRNVER